MKTVRVILSPEAEKSYFELKEKSTKSKLVESLLNAVQKKADLVKTNPHYGQPIAKPLIPTEYRTRYGITNLFRVELPQFWRLLYTLTNSETPDEITAFVLDVIDHYTYDKKFGYRRK